MHETQAFQLFQLFLGDGVSPEAYQPILDAAILEVRLAGTVAQNTDSSQKMALAKELVYAYRGLCCSLLTDDIYLFSAI